jgi:hypothetical protein
MAKEEKPKWEMAKWEKAKREYTGILACLRKSHRHFKTQKKKVKKYT